MNEITPKYSCTGCALCTATCSVKAISMNMERDGFRYPVVDQTRCMDCGLCSKNCPANQAIELYPIQSYQICQIKDMQVLKDSSSGGVSFAFAQHIIEGGGYVCGCVWDKNWTPKHILINKIEDLKKIQGSKYAQSALSAEIFQRIRELCKSGRKVLFLGTPCQVAAIRRFTLDDENLIPIDLICHGVGSPGVFMYYTKKIGRKLGEPITKVHFRSKEGKLYPRNYNMTMKSEHGHYSKPEMKDPYYAAFSSGRILRECCFRCEYAKKERVGWLSLGDYISDKELTQKVDRALGLNLVTINNQKGLEIFKKVQTNLAIKTLQNEPIKKNLERPEPRPSKRDKLNRCDIHSEKDMKRVLRRPIKDVLKSFMSSELKKRIKRGIRSFKKNK